MAFRFRSTFAAGLKALRFPGRGGVTGGSSYEFGWNGLSQFLPGAGYDYRKEAGDLWENSVVLACLKWLCRTWPEARQIVTRPGTDGKAEEVPNHPLLALLARPNPDDDWSAVEAGLLLSWLTDGNAYLYKERSAAGKVVVLRYIPHFCIEPYWPKDGSAFLSGYVYRVDGKTFLLAQEDVIHLKDGIDPRNPRKGLSQLRAVLREVCTDNEAATYSAALLRNMGVPGYFVSPRPMEGLEPLTPAQIEAFKAKWADSFQGENRGKPFVSGIPAEITPTGLSPEQLALDKVRAIPVGRICAALGLDPMVVGLPSENRTYSNYAEAREAAYESNVIPTQRVFDSQITRQLMGEMVRAQPGDLLARDYSQVRVLQADMDKLWARVTHAWKAGLIKRKTGLRIIGEAFDETADDVYFTDRAAPGDAGTDEDEDDSTPPDGEKSGSVSIKVAPLREEATAGAGAAVTPGGGETQDEPGITDVSDGGAAAG